MQRKQYYFQNGSPVSSDQKLFIYPGYFKLFCADGNDKEVDTICELPDNTTVPVFHEDDFLDAELFYFDSFGIFKIPQTSRVFNVSGSVFFESSVMGAPKILSAFSRFDLLQMSEHCLDGKSITKENRVFVRNNERYIYDKQGLEKLIVHASCPEKDYYAYVDPALHQKALQDTAKNSSGKRFKWTSWDEFKAKRECSQAKKKRAREEYVFIYEQMESKKPRLSLNEPYSQHQSRDLFEFFNTKQKDGVASTLSEAHAQFCKPAF